MSKIKRKLKELNDIKLFDIPTRISSKCILAAKTNKAKELLVNCAVLANSEDYSREIDHSVKDNLPPKETSILRKFISYYLGL